MNQPGLLTNIVSDPSSNQISLCQDTCLVSEDDSDGTQTTCTVSSLSTLYSASHYNLTTNNYLVGTPFSSNASYTMAVWDNDL